MASDRSHAPGAATSHANTHHKRDGRAVALNFVFYCYDARRFVFVQLALIHQLPNEFIKLLLGLPETAPPRRAGTSSNWNAARAFRAEHHGLPESFLE